MSTSISSMPSRDRIQTLEAVRSNNGGGFDVDAWHVMDQRDNALIADELLNGSGSSAFVYSFSVSGTAVAGISVIGARHLAAHYGGIKHRLVASVQKIGALHTFTSYPAPGMPMAVHCAIIHELEEEDDYYEAIIEIADIKTGNQVQVQKRESRRERKRDGTTFERPHYQVIAQSKAFRNGVLSLIPQDVQLKFKIQMLELGKDVRITDSVIEQKRAGVLRFAARHALTIDRKAMEGLTVPQLSGLSDAARGEGSGVDIAAFRKSAEAVGVVVQASPQVVETRQLPERQAPPKQSPPTSSDGAKTATQVKQESFSAYVIDQHGEVLGDVHTDPKKYEAILAPLLMQASPEEWTALTEHNADGMDAARKLGISWDSDSDSDSADPAAAMPLKQGTRGADVAGWIKAAKAQIATLDAVGQMAEWIGNNGEVWRPFPAPRRLEVEKIVSERCVALGMSWSPHAPSKEPEPEDSADADVIGDEVAEADNSPDLEAVLKRRNAALLNLRKTDLRAYQTLEGKIGQRRAELRAKEAE